MTENDPNRVDPIVEKVRRHGQDIIREAGGLEAYFAQLMRRQEAHPERYVKFPPRRIDPTGPGAASNDAA